ncbi:helix-turn-helix transcriptional regulator [Rhodococcus sp. HM1]|nr:LuxR C-terminal-related transcriptional regulator [Rhodococcus sp. HM1]MCK8671891.1 helix-turn-helix transcriptional regulator [Rhodococcus sp. HM1]
MSSPALPRVVAHALTADPPRLLVVGGAHTGKTKLLNEIRQTLPHIVVVDDAHRLPADEIRNLADRMIHGDHGIVVATEPRPHRAEMLQLMSTGAAHACTVALRPLTIEEALHRATAFGISDPTLVRAVLSFTGGARDLADAAFAAVREGADPRSAAVDRVRTRLAGNPGLAGALALVELGGAPDPAELTAALGIDADLAHDLADAAHASGLLTTGGDELVPAASGVPAASLGPHGFRTVAQGLLSCRVDRDLLTVPVASRLAAAGLTDPRLADYLAAQADSSNPAEASDLYAAAVRAGADAADLALRRAEVAAATGDRSTAAALTDEILERADSLSPADLATAVRIAATVAAGDGMLGRSADLYEWLGPDRAGADAPIGAAVLLAAGRPEAAMRMLETSAAVAPTSSAAAARLLAEGLRESIGGDGRVAMNALTRALSMRGTARTVVQPDTVEAITALLCLHSGELTHATNVLARHTTLTVRHELLAAWAALLGGDLSAASAAADDLSGRAVLQRDRLFLHGLRVGAARRSGDSGRLHAEWEAAQGVVAEYSVDLLSLLPLGELWLAAVRVGDAPRISHLVAQARDLLTALGEPPLWGAALHWYGVQAAIAAERPDELLPHARALAVAAESTAYAAALARAGQAWLRLLQNDVDPTRVRTAAESLAAIGLPWDGARLAGEAALRAGDTAAATGLLQVARALRHPATTTADPAATSADTVSPTTGPLSDREAQVADLVVSGLTYREVGARLYISGKTVEHHVARIRRRLGAGSRSELISMLRAMGHGGDGRISTSSSSEKKGGTSACP